MSASAEQTNIGNLAIHEKHEIFGWTSVDGGVGLSYTSGDGEENIKQEHIQFNASDVNSNYPFQQTLTVKPVDGSVIAESKIKTTITLENVYTAYLLSGTSHIYAYSPVWAQFTIYYIDGTKEIVNGNILGSSSEFEKTYKVTFTPSKDVKHFELRIKTHFYDVVPDGWTDFQIGFYYGEFAGDGRIKLTVDQPSEEAGLLEGIWGSLASGFDNLSQKLQSVVDTIVNLPSKIWEFIENGLKSLFVPDDEYMVQYKSNWENLLSDRLGAVWQVIDVTYGTWENINSADEQNTVYIPTVSIPVSKDVDFTFGGYNVVIVPERFEGIATSCKLIIAIVATYLFINGLRHRLDGILGARAS